MTALYLLSGDDEARIAEQAARLARKLAGPDADAFALELHKLSEDKAPESVLAELIASIATPPMFGDSKTIWLQHFPFPPANRKSGQLGQNLDKLAELLEAGLPPDLKLLIDGPGLTEKSRLFKAARQQGEAKLIRRPEMRDRNWGAEMAGILQAGAEQMQMTLRPTVVDYLIEVIGVETGRVQPELEKIYCFAGPEPSLEEVQAVCSGSREAHFFAFSNALGERSPGAAMRTLQQTFANSKDPDRAAHGLVRQAANTMRKLLHARLLMAYLKVSADALARRIQNLDAGEKKRFQHNSLLAMKPGQIYVVSRQAEHYSGPELLAAMRLLAQADKAMVSSNPPGRLMVEDLVLRIVGRPA